MKIERLETADDCLNCAVQEIFALPDLFMNVFMIIFSGYIYRIGKLPFTIKENNFVNFWNIVDASFLSHHTTVLLCMQMM